MMGLGKNNQQTARQINVHRARSTSVASSMAGCCRPFNSCRNCFVSDKELLAMIEEVLTDEPRSGAPVTFSAEQVTQIIAIACSDPLASGRPISHWSGKEIATEAVKRTIVETISTRSERAFFKKKPTKNLIKAVIG